MNAHRIASATRILLSSLLFLLSAATVNAQIPGPNTPQLPEPGITGEWDIMNPDGSFPLPNADVGVDININPDGSFNGDVWIDKGNGPMVVAGERMTIWQVGPGQYVFENARGRHGIIIWNPYLGRYESLMISGPNTGTERVFVD